MLRQSPNAVVTPVPVREPVDGDASVSAVSVAAEAGNLLAPYFRDLAGVEVMTKEEELAAAIQIAELRKGFWRSILNYPPFIDGICSLASEALPPETSPVAALAAMRQTSRALRDRDLLTHQKAFEAAREALAEQMGLADVDSVVSDQILADLASIELGVASGLSMKVKLPRRGSAPFFQYATAVRRDHHALVLAKNAFVRANLRLVVTIARRYNHGKMPLQDLIQEGNIGLMKAVDRFDHRKGFRFSTYGSWWIRHAISRSIADKARSVRLPVHMIDAYNKVSRARREFEALHARRPTDSELAALTGVSTERIARMRWSLVEAPISLDQPLSDDSGLSLLDAVEDPSHVAPAEQIDAALLLSQLQEVFGQLSPIEADILRKRMGIGEEPELTLKEIGERYSLSRERIRQLQEQALTKLRGEFRRRNLL
ncbi:sigma-70 family RNA polymerase sigma factor [Nannocystis punicea]|uniref:RNA polymerase sigma factor n=1 Tax=Nannocystis punicea TaxID=2995304 RepID=A0ABY7HDI6_9BACT|nr:sigma-70 family RNA polymerase sigma factor [Nannocystis poenicansa]WAS97332.1 sigma-70 family RNA polymerase sigma factor [Nannocystis poenicansa]